MSTSGYIGRSENVFMLPNYVRSGSAFGGKRQEVYRASGSDMLGEDYLFQPLLLRGPVLIGIL